MESEKKTERYLKTQIEKLGGLCYKMVSPAVRGVPDRVCMFPGGLVAFAEIKSEGKILEPLQVFIHTEMQKRDIVVVVLDSKASVDKFIGAYYASN